MREIILDTETTGLKPWEGDRITEIGCLELVDCIPTGRTYHAYINPERDVPAVVVEVTGLTAAFLADKPKFAEVHASFMTFIGDARIVAHNASFDRDFVNAELERLGEALLPDERWFDTVELARSLFPGSPASLDALCRRFNISLERRDKHGALVDAELLAEVYLELNGGRERSLDFGDAARRSGAASGRKAEMRPPRPTPLGSLVSVEEAAAHETFVATLGDAPLWAKHRSGKS